MDTTTVRISLDTHRLVKSLADKEKIQIQDVLERAIETYRQERFFSELKAAVMKTTEEQWKLERQEVAAWDGTLLDGVK